MAICRFGEGRNPAQNGATAKQRGFTCSVWVPAFAGVTMEALLQSPAILRASASLIARRNSTPPTPSRAQRTIAWIDQSGASCRVIKIPVRSQSASVTMLHPNIETSRILARQRSPPAVRTVATAPAIRREVRRVLGRVATVASFSILGFALTTRYPVTCDLPVRISQ